MNNTTNHLMQKFRPSGSSSRTKPNRPTTHRYTAKRPTLALVSSSRLAFILLSVVAMKGMKAIGVLFTVGTIVLAAGCTDISDTGGGSNVTGITDSYDAEDYICQLIEGVIERNVLSGLSDGIYNQYSVAGSLGGTATVTGSKSYVSGIYCGYDCVRSETNNDLTIVFSDYQVMSSDNVEARVNGEITYTDTTWSRQSGLSYSSGGYITGAGAGIVATFLATSGKWGYKDTVDFDVSAYKGNLYQMNGWCSCSSGTYNL